MFSDRLATRTVDGDLVRRLRAVFEPVSAIRCALLMGSHSRGIAHPRSNIDVQLVLDDFAQASVAEICHRRNQLEDKLGVAVSINAHTLTDADSSLSRYDQFSHKNRADMFVLQAKYTAVEICGENLFADFADPPPSRMRREAIRTVASFAYNLRKFVFDPTFASHGQAEFVRMPLIALEFIAAFHGYVSLGYRDGIDYLGGQDLLLAEEVAFLETCARRKSTSSYQEVTAEDIHMAVKFLDAAHARLVDDYRRRGVSDIRWNGSGYEPHWDIRRPQAASMCVVHPHHAAERVLLLRRPPTDYLYPDAWTIPGGYVNPGEAPQETAARELGEETGAPAAVGQLFEGRPVLSSRLAAFAFDAPIDESVGLRLTEHTDHRLVPLSDALGMNLTPEARQILVKYAGTDSSREPVVRSRPCCGTIEECDADDELASRGQA